jgi:hypothetical protein
VICAKRRDRHTTTATVVALRAEYQTVVEETLPERLCHLLDALDRCGEEAEATKADVAPS